MISRPSSGSSQECVTYSRSLASGPSIHNRAFDRYELGRRSFPAPAVSGPCLAIQLLRTTPFFISPFIQLLLDDQALAFFVMTPYPSRLFRERNPIIPPSLQVLVLTRKRAATDHSSGHGTSPPSTSMIERRWRWSQTKSTSCQKYP